MSIIDHPHPLHPISRAEIEQGVQILRPQLGDRATFANVGLNEPDKSAMATYQTGNVVKRRLRFCGFDPDHGSFEAIVNLLDATVEEFNSIGSGGAPINHTDVAQLVTLTKANPDWQAAMHKRGIDSYELIQIDPWPTGGFVHPEAIPGHRVLRGVSFLRTDKTDNGYARPIHGVIAHVDLTAGKVIGIDDHGVVPIPPESGRYDAEHQDSFREDLKPISISQPEGSSFTADDYAVDWQNWQFRISMHPSHGLVLHQLGYRDDGRLRPILYRAAMSDMIVPYGDIDPMHSWKHVFDASEASIGALCNSLTLGCDCLGEIHYFDINVVNWNGSARTIENAICMHEEDYGILWKHRDGMSNTQEVRRQRRLVISSMHTVGNYEYGFFWYLYLDGKIQMEIKLTGIVGVSGVAKGNENQTFAPLIAEGLASPVHQHLFCFRLDFDLDGGPNSVYEVEAKALPRGENNPYGTAFQAVSTLLKTEQQAQRDACPQVSRAWKITNPQSKNRLGNPVAFTLLPNTSPTLIADEASPMSQRAGFARHNLWVTPYDADELDAAGTYTFLHPGGDGLPRWTRENRDIENTDVVLWHTVGVTHVPRPEDWPVMPVEYCGFVLQPVGFFERNPTLDVPPASHCG